MTKRNGLRMRLLSIMTAAVISLSTLAMPLYASAAVQKQIAASVNGINVTVNGQQVSLDGMEPFNYNSSIYLPIRAISAALGISADYDNAANTVILTANVTAANTADGQSMNASPAAVQKLITVAFNNVKVTLNGQPLELKDSLGNAVEPINYNGRVYLPVRAISVALGLAVTYDSGTNTVILTSSNSQVTPAGAPGGKNSSAGKPGAGSTSVTSAYSLSSGAVSQTKKTLTAAQTDESVVKVTSGAKYTLADSKLTKTGNSSSEDNSKHYGLNAGILTESGGKTTLQDCTVSTNGSGSNAVFATGEGSTINLSKVTVKTNADYSRGLDATFKGTVIASDANITTAGVHSAAIVTGCGGGKISVYGGFMNTTGKESPGIYSTDNIIAEGANIAAADSEAAVVEGKSSITLTNTALSGTKKRGVMLYKSSSGDAEVGTSVFKMTGGSLKAAEGPLFYATNTEAIIELNNTGLSGIGKLLTASADQWGNSYSNGAKVTLKADNQGLPGDINCDRISTITVTMQNSSSLKGAVNPENTARSVALSLDKYSTWTVTGTSYLTVFKNGDTMLTNIDDNGYTIYYDANNSANDWLGGRTYTLVDGGKLAPVTSAN